MHGFSCNCPTCHDLGAQRGFQAKILLMQTSERAMAQAREEERASEEAVLRYLMKYRTK
jgi:hypothetical protein